MNDKGRSNILEIPVDDAVVMQVLHAGGQRGFGHKNKLISLSLTLPSLGGERPNIPNHCHGISFRKVATPADRATLKEFAADSELETKVVCCL